MRPAAALALVVPLVVVVLTGCSGSPDTAAAERDLAGLDGVRDVDAEWVQGSFKVASSAAVSVATGEETDADDVDRLVPGLVDALADLDWDAAPDLAVELDDEADATPFLRRLPGGEPVTRPTDVSTYTVGAADLDDRDLASDLLVLLRARDVLGAPTQVELTGEDVLLVASDLGVDAAASVSLLSEASAVRELTRDGIRWRLTGPDLTFEVESGLRPAGALLWGSLVGATDDLGGLTRDHLSLSLDEESQAVARLGLSAGGPVEESTRAVTGPAQRLFARLEAEGVGELHVDVTGPEGTRTRVFSYAEPRARWEPVG